MLVFSVGALTRDPARKAIATTTGHVLHRGY
jgi:hypothetical protein